MAAHAASIFDLTDADVWHGDFALGFLTRHALWGMNEVQHQAWWWDKVDIRRLEEALPIATEILLLNAPGHLPIDHSRAKTRLHECIGSVDFNAPRENEFGKGVWLGDRVLGGALAMSYSDDGIGSEVERAFKHYKQLPGQRPRSIHYLFRSYKWTYAYATAATLGRRAFKVNFDDRDAARRLGFKL